MAYPQGGWIGDQMKDMEIYPTAQFTNGHFMGNAQTIMNEGDQVMGGYHVSSLPPNSDSASWDPYLSILATSPVQSPVYSQPLQQFTVFRLLPPEIRLRIWRATFPRNRRVSLNLKTYFDDKGDESGEHTPYTYAYDLSNLAAVPVALHVCFESRQETLRYYRVITRPEVYWDPFHRKNRRFPFTFNPKLDIAQLGKYEARWGMPARQHKQCCGLLPPPLSRRPPCCRIYVNEALCCGNWTGLLEKYAPGLLGAIRNVCVDEVDWTPNTKDFLEQAIAKPQPTLLHSFVPTTEDKKQDRKIVYGPLLYFTSMTRLTLRLIKWWDPLVNSTAKQEPRDTEVAMYFRKFLAANLERQQVVIGQPIEVHCTETSPGLTHVGPRNNFELGLKAMKAEKFDIASGRGQREAREAREAEIERNRKGRWE